METKSAPTLSPLRKGLAEATKRPQAAPNPFGIPNRRRPLASRTLAALLLFGLVSLTWATFRWGQLAPEDYSFDTWTSCAVNDFLHTRKAAPDIAFLGSSLVLFPSGQVDADLANKPVDGPHHHSILFFERAFQSITGKKVSTFNFALPGEMPSDAYLISKNLFQGDKRPQVIVYGVGPRDFMDNLLPSPSATDPFHHLARFNDYSTLIDKVSPEVSDRFNYELGRLIFTYGQKDDLSHGFDRSVKNSINDKLTGIPSISLKLRRKLLPDYRTMEVGTNDCLFQPYVTRPRPPFVDNLAEYTKRYKSLKWDTFLTQMEFLSKTMDVARERGIPFVLVSMPITDINRNLIGTTAATAYRESLRLLAHAKNATFLELDGTKNYNIYDYEDTVHLHSGGGRKMLLSIAVALANDTKIRQALGQAKSATQGIPISSNGTDKLSADGKGTSSTGKKVATRRESFL